MLVLVSACKKEEEVADPAIQLAADKILIQEYLTENNIDAIQTESGLSYIIETEGTGTEYPSELSRVTLKYRGYRLNGQVFDETYGNSTQTFQLNGVVKGMQEGVQLFKAGAKGKLFIPSGLGYGTVYTGSIPENSVLIFEIEIISFIND